MYGYTDDIPESIQEYVDSWFSTEEPQVQES